MPTSTAPQWVLDAQAAERAMRVAAAQPLAQYERGLLTVGELALILARLAS